jgi:hypothetical protein
MLSDYLNQAVQLQRCKRDTDGNAIMDHRGKMTYLAPVSIACRIRQKHREVLTVDKQTIVIECQYYTTEPVQIDDLLDGHRVQDVSPMILLDGSTLGYKAVV